MKTITATLEAQPDGTLHLPVPPELQHGKLLVTATLEPLECSKPAVTTVARRTLPLVPATGRLITQQEIDDALDAD